MLVLVVSVLLAAVRIDRRLLLLMGVHRHGRRVSSAAGAPAPAGHHVRHLVLVLVVQLVFERRVRAALVLERGRRGRRSLRKRLVNQLSHGRAHPGVAAAAHQVVVVLAAV